jgi:hypothetical protein
VKAITIKKTWLQSGLINLKRLLTKFKQKRKKQEDQGQTWMMMKRSTIKDKINNGRNGSKDLKIKVSLLTMRTPSRKTNQTIQGQI